MHDWNAIVKSLGPRLKSYFAVSFSDALSADLVQETLIRLLHKVESKYFDPEKGSLSALAFGIAHNVRRECKSTLGRELLVLSSYQNHAVREPVRNPEEIISQMQHSAKLKLAIQKLKSNEQEILSLYLEKDLSLEEIAKIVDMSVGTVKSHLFRAKEALKKHLMAI